MKINNFSKIVAIITILSLSVTIAFGYSETDKVKETLNDYDIIYTDNIARFQCITSIMRVLGMTDNDSDKVLNVDFNGGIFSDGAMGSIEGGYILLAGISDIALGYGEWYASPFAPYRDVTLKECVAFMMRCLTDNTGDLDATFEHAKEIGLVLETDVFYNNGDDFLEKEDFNTLLYRMMNKKRYKYFEKNIYITKSIQTDMNGEMTYIEYLNTLRTDA